MEHFPCCEGFHMVQKVQFIDSPMLLSQIEQFATALQHLHACVLSPPKCIHPGLITKLAMAQREKLAFSLFYIFIKFSTLNTAGTQTHF